MRPSKANTLDLGPDVIRLLIPHRPPFLMVDRVRAFTPGETPALAASRHITPNEPVFAGHFPDRALWPGVYTIEGLGQSCHLLAVIDGIRSWLAAAGRDPDAALVWLRNVELGARLHPGFRPELGVELATTLQASAATVGLAAAIDVKLLHPVFAGEVLDYHVRRTDVVGDKSRFEVEARVGSTVVARGTLTGAALSLRAAGVLEG